MRTAICALLCFVTLPIHGAETATFPDGSTGYLIKYCPDVPTCERRAKQLCGDKKYRVHERRSRQVTSPESSERQRPDDWDQPTKGNRMPIFGAKPHGWESLLVECNPKDPPPATATDKSYAKALQEYVAAMNKRNYMREVCEIQDREMRRQEMLIARYQYGADVSCDEF
jgi:hypothetical protein